MTTARRGASFCAVAAAWRSLRTRPSCRQHNRMRGSKRRVRISPRLLHRASCPNSRSQRSVSNEHDGQEVSTNGHGFRAGIDDVIIVPLVVSAFAAESVARTALSILIRILDMRFLLRCSWQGFLSSPSELSAMARLRRSRASWRACRFRKKAVRSGASSSARSGPGSDSRSAISGSNRRSIERSSTQWNGFSGNAEILRLVRPCMSSPAPFYGFRCRLVPQPPCTYCFWRRQLPCPPGCSFCIHSRPSLPRASS